MSLDDIRNMILSDSCEEQVETNQRLLIDKILARYSSKFVTYRELMQNSDDAKSSSIQIKFETENNEIDNKTCHKLIEKAEDKVIRVLFKNNGLAFKSEDWNRLKKIAEGNPDVRKIGAFGVGFYSLFSICEEPFVSSGGQGMAFYWKGNQLFTKKGPTSPTYVDDEDHWTTFLMDMKRPIEFPSIEEFARFLANSLVFTEHLQEVSVYYNNTLVIKLSKKIQDLKSVDITNFYRYSSQMIFRLTSVDVKSVQLNVIIRTNLVEYHTEEKSIRFRIANGNLDFRDDDEFSSKIEQIIKKKPPNKTSIQIIFTGFDEYNDNLSEGQIYPVFKDLLPHPEQGMFYIGFPTNQSTGCCSHLAARVIPTMERVSIDFADVTLLKYNSEMLCLSGTLNRVLYEDEMDEIARLYNTKIDINTEDDENTKSIRECFEKRAAYTLAHFTFNPSKPHWLVGNLTESKFFSCLKQKLSILSTNGVLPISDVRIPNLEMMGFMKTTPVVPKIILEQCDTFFKKVKNAIIKELDLQDVLRELENRTLSEDEIVELLKWWISYRSKNESKDNDDNQSNYSKFLQLARVGEFQSLSEIRYFLNPSIIPPNVDIPKEVLPHNILKKLKDGKSKNNKNNELIIDLEKWFRWTELPLVHWAKYIIDKPDLVINPEFAEEVHTILARGFNNVSQKDKKIICELFKNKKCIPTKLGMMIPSETYFDDVNIFPDLPCIQFQKFQKLSTSIKNLMELFGVRKVVKLELILDRLDGPDQGNCDHLRLVKYLASTLNDRKENENENEIEILRNRPIWHKANSNNKYNKSKGMNRKQRFIAKDLYVPCALHRELGLPIIGWKETLSRNSQEGKLLITLGIQEYPTFEHILKLAAPPTKYKIREKALKYFINNFEKKYSQHYKSSEVNIEFLPCSNSNIYAKPSECFINPNCMIMKFKAIRKDLEFKAGMLGVRQDPDREELLNRLFKDLPRNENKAKETFEYLASQQGSFISSDWKILSNFKFIPIRDKIQPNKVIYTNPHDCFFNIQEEMHVLKEYFSCIDFGEKANKFLRCCGVESEPSSINLAKLLVKSSCELWESICSIEKTKDNDNTEIYLRILRKISLDFHNILSSESVLKEKMKTAPILVAIKKEYSDSNNKYINNCYLFSAKEIYINDDIIYQQLFNPLTAPEVDLLDELYKSLGCESLQKSVKETSTPMGNVRKNENSQQLQKVIIDRASLFYHESNSNNIKKDENWLKSLKVREVDCIYTEYFLKTTRKNKTNEAIILQDKGGMDSWTLYITNKSISLDVSRQIVKNIFRMYKWKDVLSISTLLTAPLLSLKEMGYPVDRILQQQKYSQQPVATNQKNLQNSLQNYVKNDKDTNNINSQAIYENYCKIIPDHLLSHVGIMQGIKLYDTKNNRYETEILSRPYNRFVKILKDLADVFELQSNIIHVLYADITTIAFNCNGELFFNLKYYCEYHDEDCIIKPTVDALAYWFMTFCHELAHNYVKPHGTKHEYYMSSFAEKNMSKFLTLINKKYEIILN